MSPTTITSKGQITIPVEYRQIPGYGPGDKVNVYRDLNGRLVIESFEDWIGRTRGMLRAYAINAPNLAEEQVEELVAQAIAEDAMDLGGDDQNESHAG